MNLVDLILWLPEKLADLICGKEEKFDYESTTSLEIDDPIDYEKGVDVLRRARDIPCEDDDRY